MSQRPIHGFRTSICLLIWLAAASLQASPSAAQNQETSAASTVDPVGYRRIVDEAVREFTAHNYEESRSLFRRAHVLYPNARTHRGLGLAEFELRNYGECIRHLEAALRSQVKPLTPELRDDTERMLTRANNFVARVVLNVKPDVSRVVVDGVSLDVAADKALMLQIGEHTVEVQAPGFIAERRKLSVQGGEQNTLNVVLSRSSAPASAPLKARRSWYKSPWLWTAVGVVVVGGAAGAGYAAARPDEPAAASGGSAATVLSGP